MAEQRMMATYGPPPPKKAGKPTMVARPDGSIEFTFSDGAVVIQPTLPEKQA